MQIVQITASKLKQANIRELMEWVIIGYIKVL